AFLSLATPPIFQPKKPRLSTPSLPPNNATQELATAQLYALSTRKHRDAARLALQRARIERDRANLAMVQAERWLQDANDNLAIMEEELREVQKEYSEARSLTARLTAGGFMMPEESEEENDAEENGGERPKSGRLGQKYKRAPLITDLLVEMAKSGDLVDGKKLHEANVDINERDRTKFVNAMMLVEELWTDEEELFLRSPPREIAESIEELKIIAATIGERCLVKLNEWEGRDDPTPTPHQKPSIVSVGIRARKAFLDRDVKKEVSVGVIAAEERKEDEDVVVEKTEDEDLVVEKTEDDTELKEEHPSEEV
ncbi:hypothetical protein ACHAW6_012311, partial [Cyclotella cf. meneghiniana]